MSALANLNANIQALTLAVAAAIPDINPTPGSGATEAQVQAAADAVAAQTALLTAAVAPPNTGAVPTNVVSTVSPGGTVGLSFTGVAGAQSYNVKRGATKGGPYAVVATVTSVGPFTEGGLPLNVPEFYVISAVVNGVESANSAEVSAMPTS